MGKGNNNNNKRQQSLAAGFGVGGRAKHAAIAKRPATTDSLTKRLDKLMSSIPRGTFAAAGGALGGPVGGMAGRALSNISGYGDYVVNSNTVARNGAHGGVEVPSFSNRSVRMTHREYFSDVVVPVDATGFNNASYDLSPSNPLIAPWLSKITAKFAKYKIHGLVFYYKPMSSDYNNSGTIAMAVNYDPMEDKFESMGGILNSKFAVSTKPAVAMVAPVECDPSTLFGGGTLIVDHPTLAKNTDRRFTSMGTLNVATQGLTLPPGAVLGQLHMTIDLELINPMLHRRQYEAQISRGYRNSNTLFTYDVPPSGVQVTQGVNSSTFIAQFEPGTYSVTREHIASTPGDGDVYNGQLAAGSIVPDTYVNTETGPLLVHVKSTTNAAAVCSVVMIFTASEPIELFFVATGADAATLVEDRFIVLRMDQ